VVSERIAIQSKHRLVSLSLQFEPLGIDVTGLEVNLAIVELEDRYVAVSIDGGIVWMRWHKRIYHYSIEAAIDLLGNLTEDYLQ